MKDKRMYAGFELMEWEAAFNEWDHLYAKIGNKISFVISTNDYTSGYWIQSCEYPKLSSEYIYRTDSEVQALKQRIIAEIERAKFEAGSPRFTT